MKTLAIDTNNDLVVKNNNLSISTDIQAVLYTCEHIVKAQYGEMIYAIDRGIPYNLLAWDRQPNFIQLEAFIRRAILTVPEVTSITDLGIQIANHSIKYSITINTTYGIGVLDNVRISQ